MAQQKKQSTITINVSNIDSGKFNKHGLPVGLTIAKLKQAQKYVIHNAIIEGRSGKSEIQKIERAYSSLFKQIDRAAQDRAFIRDMRAAKGPKAIDTSKVSQDKYTRAIANRFSKPQQLARLGFNNISTYAKPMRDATGRITSNKTNPNTKNLYLHVTKLRPNKARDTFKHRPGDIQAIKYAYSKGYIPKKLAIYKIEALKLKTPKIPKGPRIVDPGGWIDKDALEEFETFDKGGGGGSGRNQEFDDIINRMGGILQALERYPDQVLRLAEEYGVDLNEYYGDLMPGADFGKH